jgi:hypothetical protein
VVEGIVSVLELLVDEFAADLLLVGQFGDRLTGESIEGELLASLGGQQTGWVGKDSSGRLG